MTTANFNWSSGIDKSPVRGMLPQSPLGGQNQAVPSRIYASSPDSQTDRMSLLSDNYSYKEHTSPSKMISPPPPYLPPWSYNILTDENASEALMKHVMKKCCYGKSALRDMRIKSMMPQSTFQYCLESFHETREIMSKNEPYKGHTNPIHNHDMEPNHWDIEVPKRDAFCDGVQLIEIPNSSSVKTCWGCHGNGRQECKRCYGKPKTHCITCQRRGNIDGRTCSSCHGHGMKICDPCHGCGFISCNVCQGFCKVRSYKLVKVKWSTHKSIQISNPTDLPSKKIENVSGMEVLCHLDREVEPVTSIPDGKINQISMNSLQRHNDELKSSLVHMQRQTVHTIPVTEVEVDWKSQKTFRFWIYGDEERVHCPKYPKRFGDQCAIL